MKDIQRLFMAKRHYTDSWQVLYLHNELTQKESTWITLCVSLFIIRNIHVCNMFCFEYCNTFPITEDGISISVIILCLKYLNLSDFLVYNLA